MIADPRALDHVDESVVVPLPATAVWSALIRRTAVRLWWGALDQDLGAVAGEAVLRTGSTSFYRLWVERSRPLELLELSSSYLGVAPPSTIRFEIIEPATVPAPGGDLVVRVRERLAAPEPATVYLAAELWRFRLSRLQAMLQGAAVPRESDVLLCRRPLSTPTWRPLHRKNLRTWLPVSTDVTPPRWFYAIDSLGARPFPVATWQVLYDERLLIGIRVGRLAVTRAEVSVAPGETPSGLVLQASHRGWSGVSRDAEDRFVLRSRFQATWHEALSRATAEPSR